MTPPKTLAKIKIGKGLNRPERENGKTRAENTKKCRILSVPWGFGSSSDGENAPNIIAKARANVK